METESVESASDAVSFLLSRVAEQARTDSVSLSDTELQQLSFREETASPQEVSAVVDFDSANDVAKFEAKVVKLLHRAYGQDLENGKQHVWQKHLAALGRTDVYVLVMVDEAGIPRSKPGFFSVTKPTLPRKILPLLRFVICAIVGLAGLLYFILLSLRWQRGNPNSAPVLGDLSRFRLSDNMAALLFVAWVASLFLMWRDMRDRS